MTAYPHPMSINQDLAKMSIHDLLMHKEALALRLDTRGHLTAQEREQYRLRLWAVDYELNTRGIRHRRV